ncbi:hypothetical protein AB1Y20_014949 [Prymnesium parvum]|uniref:YdbS-like PH domain-containing protein n=1 Tax=Prymnesium parvum TaxID=97485 RepID=A0AB34JZX6_PRYPA|mmetsp:Transcript_22630/g.54464  ORF Transcript_22630/g.54464 Transcript_22630/m.54464 type:complete len:231 (+) Transcript_22630:35-727(+)
MRSFVVISLATLSGCAALSFGSVVARPAVASACRSPAVRCAYNPQPSKARPKKQKSKAPKEKVKAPVAPLAVDPEVTFFEGPPSATEMVIPGMSVLTVVGIIPFAASVARQAWTRYKFTNRRIEVASGFQGKEVVQATWREVVDVKWLRRFGGSAGDLVLTLKDGAKMEMRSVPDFERNLAYMMKQLGEDVQADCFYPDGPAKAFQAKLASGEEPPLTPSTSTTPDQPSE